MGNTLSRLDNVAHQFNNNWWMVPATDKAFGLVGMHLKVAILDSRLERVKIREMPVVPVPWVAGLVNP